MVRNPTINVNQAGELGGRKAGQLSTSSEDAVFDELSGIGVRRTPGNKRFAGGKKL
jgi:hypothetical protein